MAWSKCEISNLIDYNTNEIDLVMINDLEKIIVLAEIKIKKSRIRILDLKKKGEKLLNYYPGYSANYLALSMEDISNYIKSNSDVDII